MQKSIISELLRLARDPETTPKQATILRQAADALCDSKLVALGFRKAKS
jgi:hypothetical protein